MNEDMLIQVEIVDAAGETLTQAELPINVEVSRLTHGLVEQLGLPRTTPDGQMMTYKLNHPVNQRQLLPNETLAMADVRPGQMLRLFREILAG